MTTFDPGPVLSALMDATDDAVLGLDHAGRILLWNRGAARLFGYPRAEVAGSPFDELFPPHVRPEISAVIAAVVAGDRPHRIETDIGRRDGMPTPISLSAQPVNAAKPGEVAAVAIARDITEQRLAQATLAVVQARVREGEALTHVGGWLWDVRTGAVQWTDEMHRIHGVDPLDFGGTLDAHLACVVEEDRARVREAMTGAVARRRPFEVEHRIVRADGEVCTMVLQGTPTTASTGDVVGLRGIAQDVTALGGTGSSRA
jgi:PAS domain S-box-containing protein